MNRRQLKRLEVELEEFVETVVAGLGRVERRANLAAYITGLLLDGDRKSIEPMASRLVDDAGEVEGMRQRLQQAVSVAAWSEREVFDRLTRMMESELPGIEALVIDDTGFPKKGEHSVGVQRQYSGTLGRVDNCQVATSLHLAGEGTSACIGLRLFMPEVWATDPKRRRSAGVPEDVSFQTKLEIALALLDSALAAGVRKHVVLADAGYGDSTELREALTARDLTYVVGINGEITVWPPGSDPQIPPKPAGLGGGRRTRYRDEQNPPQPVKDLAPTLRYRRVTWREGSRGWQSSRFAAVRIRTAHRHSAGHPPGEEQWLLCQWPDDEPAPTKYWLSTRPATASTRNLVRLAKLRWRVERDYQEMKQEIGLDHFEGRTWRGFHHHAALCAAAHAFLALRRALFPPEDMSVDPADGPPAASAGPAAPHRHLSPMPSRHAKSRASVGGIADVIESY